MKFADEQLTPVPRPNVDYSKLESMPSPEDFFVLSRVDGATTIAQLCVVSGLGRERTLEALERLQRAGLIATPGVAAAASPEAGAAATDGPKSGDEPGSEPRPRRSNKLPPPNYAYLPYSPDDYPYDPELLAVEVELDDDVKREVMCLHGQLQRVTHYQLLGVPTTANRKELRAAYFSLSKRFHPDGYYGRILGPFGPMIEKVFQHTVKAYETLSNPRKRGAYDETLSAPREVHTTPVPVSAAHQRSEPVDEETLAERKRELAVSTLVKRGNAHWTAGHIESALEEFRNALRIKHDPKLATDVARRLAATGERLEEAAMFARVALKIDAQYVDAMLILGEIYQQKNAPDEALRYYEQVRKLEPRRPEVQSYFERSGAGNGHG